MANFSEKYLGHILTLLISVLLAGVIGFFSAQITVIDRIHAVKSEADKNIGALTVSYTKLSTNVEHMRKTLEDIVVPQLNTVAASTAKHTTDMTVIKNDLRRVSAYIEQQEESIPERIRQEERNRAWRRGMNQWQHDIDQKLENLLQPVDARSNP